MLVIPDSIFKETLLREATTEKQSFLKKVLNRIHTFEVGNAPKDYFISMHTHNESLRRYEEEIDVPMSTTARLQIMLHLNEILKHNLSPYLKYIFVTESKGEQKKYFFVKNNTTWKKVSNLVKDVYPIGYIEYFHFEDDYYRLYFLTDWEIMRGLIENVVENKQLGYGYIQSEEDIDL